ncbi:MAG: helix-turn-helix domain-containing protein, partial [Simplicispira sp.]|nr:helix-turn-helix domain-containing protein [Simplicispira sp.]
HLLAQYSAVHGKRVAGFTDHALSALRSHDWPGNVRELENLVERGVILAPQGALIDAPMLFPQLQSHTNATVNAAGTLQRATTTADPVRVSALYDTLARSGLSLDGLEDALIGEAVQRAGGNLAAAARTLGLTRPQLSYRLARQQERAR